MPVTLMRNDRTRTEETSFDRLTGAFAAAAKALDAFGKGVERESYEAFRERVRAGEYTNKRAQYYLALLYYLDEGSLNFSVSPERKAEIRAEFARDYEYCKARGL